LQEALSEKSGGFGYYIFDLLHLDGEDLRARPLIERKEKLKSLLEEIGAPLLYSSHIEGDGGTIFAPPAISSSKASSRKKRTIVTVPAAPKAG